MRLLYMGGGTKDVLRQMPVAGGEHPSFKVGELALGTEKAKLVKRKWFDSSVMRIFGICTRRGNEHFVKEMKSRFGRTHGAGYSIWLL